MRKAFPRRHRRTGASPYEVFIRRRIRAGAYYRRLLANHQHRRGDFVTHAVDRVSEDQIFHAAMAVRTHHDQIRPNLARQPDDLVFGAVAVDHPELGVNPFIRQRLHDPVKVFFAGLNFRGGR